MFTLGVAIFEQYFKYCAFLGMFKLRNLTNLEQNLHEKIMLNSFTAVNIEFKENFLGFESGKSLKV